MEGILALGVGKSGQIRSQCTDMETFFTLCMNAAPLDNHDCEYKDSTIQPPIANLIYLEAEGPHHLIRTNPYLLRKNPCAHCSEQTKDYIGTYKPFGGWGTTIPGV